MSDPDTRANATSDGDSPGGPIEPPAERGSVTSNEPSHAAPAADAAKHGTAPNTTKHTAKFPLMAQGNDLAFRDWRAWASFVLIIVMGIAMDLGSKWWSFEHVAEVPAHPDPQEVMLRLADNPATVGLALPPHDPMPVLPGVLDFFLVLNPGAVFGAGPGQRWAFISFTAVTLLFAVYVFACWTRRGQWLTQSALALVIAGGVGNLYDRVTLGVVRDFLHFFPSTNLPFGLRWPSGNTELWPYISNIADKFVLFGIAVLMVKLWRVDRAAVKATKEARNSG